MSDGCGNPDCVTHGGVQRAKTLRDAKQKVAINEELMGVIRTLAANVDEQLTTDSDGQVFMSRYRQVEILKGNMDSHPAVQGLMNGFAVLVCSHRPSQEFYNTTRMVPEGEGFIAQARKEAEQMVENQGGFTSRDFPGGKAFEVRNVEQLLALLRMLGAK